MPSREHVVSAALDEMACDGLFLCELQPEGYMPTSMTMDELHAATKSLSEHGLPPVWHDEEVWVLLVFLKAIQMRHGLVVCRCDGKEHQLVHPDADGFAEYCQCCDPRPSLSAMCAERGLDIEGEIGLVVELAKDKGLIPLTVDLVCQSASVHQPLTINHQPALPARRSEFRQWFARVLARVRQSLGLPRG